MKRSSVLLLLIVFISLSSFAQNSYKQDYKYYDPNVSEPEVKFGYMAAEALTVEQILGTPKLLCRDNDCEVLGYQIRISRRGDDFYGPYNIKGSELSAEVKRVLKNSEIERGTLYFENVRIKINGKEMMLSNDYTMKYKR